MTQQMSDVAEPLGVLETKGVPTAAYGPVLSLFAENRLLGPGGALKHGCHDRFNGLTILALRFHLIFPLALVTSDQRTPRPMLTLVTVHAPSAVSRASIKASSLNGFVRKPIAPAFSACSRVSPFRAVMKMMGI